jgi:hypothetical protein
MHQLKGKDVTVDLKTTNFMLSTEISLKYEDADERQTCE